MAVCCDATARDLPSAYALTLDLRWEALRVRPTALSAGLPKGFDEAVLVMTVRTFFPDCGGA